MHTVIVCTCVLLSFLSCIPIFLTYCVFLLAEGGTKPNLADLAVFGVLRPIRYLRSGIDMVENTQIGDWYARMESVVGGSSRIMT